MEPSLAPVTAAKPFTLSLAQKSTPAPSALAPTVPAKRNRAAFAEDDDSDEERDLRGPQAVTGFGENGAIVAGTRGKRAKKEPLVIPVQRDADWRRPGKGSGKGRNLLPAEEQARRIAEQRGDQEQPGPPRNSNGGPELEEVDKTQYGLVVKARSEQDGRTELDNTTLPNPSEDAPKQKTADEEAYDRLVNGSERKSHLVIQGTDDYGAENNGFASGGCRADEPDFRTDVAGRPESSTIADYEAVPIEEFGAALLRGMGWKEGGGVGRARKNAVQPKTLEKRPNLLGIGAKHVPEGLEELGAWGKGAAKSKGPKTREAYNPVVMRNIKTGETLTEEEKEQREKRRRQEEKEQAERQAEDVRQVKASRRDRDRYVNDDDRDSLRRHRSRSKERPRRRRSRSQERRSRHDDDRHKRQDRSHRHREDRDRYRDEDRGRSNREYDVDGHRRRASRGEHEANPSRRR